MSSRQRENFEDYIFNILNNPNNNKPIYQKVGPTYDELEQQGVDPDLIYRLTKCIIIDTKRYFQSDFVPIAYTSNEIFYDINTFVWDYMGPDDCFYLLDYLTLISKDERFDFEIRVNSNNLHEYNFVKEIYDKYREQIPHNVNMGKMRIVEAPKVMQPIIPIICE